MPNSRHSIGTKVNKAYLARIEAERVAAITPEERERQDAWADHFAALKASGHEFGPPREPLAGVGDDWADNQFKQMTKSSTSENDRDEEYTDVKAWDFYEQHLRAVDQANGN